MTKDGSQVVFNWKLPTRNSIAPARLMNMVTQPHYLLICDSVISNPALIDGQPQLAIGLGRWNFVLERIDGLDRLEAQDCENYIHQDRLALLAVVRGLEALEQSSMVRLVTTSRYVDRGIRFGLPNWRETSYQWERFGVRKPVRNADLWRRVDVAMQYHEIACRLLKSSLADSDAQNDEFSTVASASVETSLAGSSDSLVAMVGSAEPCLPTPPLNVAPTGIIAAELVPTGISANQAANGRVSMPVTKPIVDQGATELVARFAPSRVVFRVDSAHRPPSTSHHVKTAQPKPVTKPARLQWWEMATNWEKPVAMSSFPQAAPCGG
ncbi:MAG: hypothetical protein U0930_07545 [Pirellulales bacterium]